MPRPLHDLLVQPGFGLGLALGVAFAVGCFALALLASPSRRPVAVVGVAFWLATWMATKFSSISFHDPGIVFLALALLGVAGTASARLRLAFLPRLLLALPGAMLIAATRDVGAPAFTRPFLIIFVVVGAAAASEWNRWKPVTDAGPLLLLLSAAGVYVCVPDTEHAAVALVVAIPLAFLGWPGRYASVGAGGAAAFVGVLAWLAGTDGYGRPSAVVGAAACVGVFAFVPVLARLGVPLEGSGRMRSGLRPIIAIVVVQAALVAVSSRVAGLASSALAAASIATLGYAGALVAVGLLFMSRGRRAAPGGVT